MKIKDENGQIHTLEIKDKNGVDWTVDYVNGFFDTNEDDEYVGMLVDIQWFQSKITRDLTMEQACDLADELIREHYAGQIDQEEINGDIRYTDEAQDVFNSLYDYLLSDDYDERSPAHWPTIRNIIGGKQ